MERYLYTTLLEIFVWFFFLILTLRRLPSTQFIPPKHFHLQIICVLFFLSDIHIFIYLCCFYLEIELLCCVALPLCLTQLVNFSLRKVFVFLFYFISFDFILLHFTFLLDSIRPELVCLSTHRFAASNKTNGMIFLLCFARTRTRSHCIDLCKCKSMCVCFACTSICWLCVGPDLRYVCANLKPYLSIIFIRLPFAYTFSHI